MLEKPEVAEEGIVACLREAYGVRAAEVAFLPLGADLNTAVYSVTGEDGRRFFLKLRGGRLDEWSVTLPHITLSWQMKYPSTKD